ncbi:hypothetical protein PG996_005122 [Apiospora saccharicola]|uniref:Uncharacterized protein n=1 Tax=Apiospora saccharicola TaxID=335842 RepID=A0ABR1VKL2_9PEZI
MADKNTHADNTNSAVMEEQRKFAMTTLNSIPDPNDLNSKSRFSDWGEIAASCGMTEPHAKTRFGEIKGFYVAVVKEAPRTKPVINKKRDDSKPAPKSRL